MRVFAVFFTIAALILIGGTADAAVIQKFVDARSGPWLSSVNPGFNWGQSTLPPLKVDQSSGLNMFSGDTLTITYVSGIANGGGAGIFGDANGNAAAYGNLVGHVGDPSEFINPADSPIVYFMALLGAFTDSSGVIVGAPFLIGNGHFSIVIPGGATTLSMGFNDGNNGFFDNSGGVTMRISEVPEPGLPGILCAMLVGFAALRAGRGKRDNRSPT